MFIKYFKLLIEIISFFIRFISFCLNLASVPVISTTSLTNTSTTKSNNNNNNTTSSSVVLTHQSASNSQTQQQSNNNNNTSPQVQVPILSLMAVPLGQQPGENKQPDKC